MAAKRNISIETQQKRLRLKQEQLTLRVKVMDAKKRHREVTDQLKALGGRIR